MLAEGESVVCIAEEILFLRVFVFYMHLVTVVVVVVVVVVCLFVA